MRIKGIVVRFRKPLCLTATRITTISGALPKAIAQNWCVCSTILAGMPKTFFRKNSALPDTACGIKGFKTSVFLDFVTLHWVCWPTECHASRHLCGRCRWLSVLPAHSGWQNSGNSPMCRSCWTWAPCRCWFTPGRCLMYPAQPIAWRHAPQCRVCRMCPCGWW